MNRGMVEMGREADLSFSVRMNGAHPERTLATAQTKYITIKQQN
jgi:hypothetical protein